MSTVAQVSFRLSATDCMPDLFDLLTQLVGERPSAQFAMLLVVHIASGLTAVVTGATAMLSPKRSGWHPRAGATYYTALCVLCATAVGMAAVRWLEDAYLVVLGALSLAAASLGYVARRRRWPGWIRMHILGMGASYIVLLTAFYVDNGPRLPLWDRLPVLVFWIVPSLIGSPLVAVLSSDIVPGSVSHQCGAVSVQPRSSSSGRRRNRERPHGSVVSRTRRAIQSSYSSPGEPKRGRW